jgi:hypothetical protein
MLISMLISDCLLLVISFLFDRLFPHFTLELQNKETWLKRNSTEITVVAAILAALAALISAIAAFYS